MKIGDKVNLYDTSNGKRRSAIVEAIGKAGPSLAKSLNLRVGSGDDAERFEAVPHGADFDNENGTMFWLRVGDRPARGWDEEEVQPSNLDAEQIEVTAEATETTRTPRRGARG